MPLITLRPFKKPAFEGSFWISYLGACSATGDQSYDTYSVAGDGMYVSGYYRCGGGNNDGLTLKYDLNGNVLWTYVNDEFFNEIYRGVVHDGTAGYWTGTTIGSRVRGLAEKRLSNGTSAWAKRVTDATENLELHGAITDGTHLYIQGSNRNASNIHDIYLVKLQCSDGSFVWDANLGDTGNTTHEYGGIGYPAFNGSDIIVCGKDSSNNWILASFTSAGVLNWQRSINVGVFTGTLEVATDSSNNIYLMGDAHTSGSLFRGLVFKLNSTGSTILWQKEITPPAASRPLQLSGIRVHNDEIYMVGTEYTDPSGQIVGYVIKMDASGNEVYSERLRYFINRSIYFNGLSIGGGGLSVAGAWQETASGGSNANLACRFPLDQSLYGTYNSQWIYEDNTGNFTYTTPTYSVSTPSFVVTNPSRTVENITAGISQATNEQKIVIA